MQCRKKDIFTCKYISDQYFYVKTDISIELQGQSFHPKSQGEPIIYYI